MKVPIISGAMNRFKRQSSLLEDDLYDDNLASKSNQTFDEPVVHVDSNIYCSIIESLRKGCLLFSILDIWDFDSAKIAKDSTEEIITKINTVKVSPTLGYTINFSELLGNVTLDEKNRIIAATAIRTDLIVHVSFFNVDMDKIGNNAGTTDMATDEVLNWESAYLEKLKNLSYQLQTERNTNDSLMLYYDAGRSFGDISGENIFRDVDKLCVGIFICFWYILIIASNYNWVEWRIYLTSIGLLSVSAAFIFATAICSLIGIPYGVVHTTAGKMEVDAAVEMFGKSEKLHDVKYTSYVGDGDCKTFKGVTESTPYGLGGKGKLTAKLDELSVYYGLVIRKNKDSVPNMKKAIWATLKHKSSTDKNPQHENCPPGKDSCCTWQQAKAENKLADYKYKTALPDKVLKAITPVYEELSNKDLLERCVGGYTQNNNESLNVMIWSFAPKRTFSSSETVEIASYFAASIFNEGFKSILNMMQVLNIRIGTNVVDMCNMTDKQRVSIANTRTFDASRERRIEKRTIRLAVEEAFLEETFLEEKGPIYILPTFRSFCIYAAVGIFVTLLLQITFFIACFTLDAKRIEQKRNGILPCIVHENFAPKSSDMSSAFSWKLINFLYSRILLTTPGKIIIILITLLMMSISIMGLLQLQQWYDPKWLLSKDSYLHQFIAIRDEAFPNQGYEAFVIMGDDIDYSSEFSKIISMTERLQNASFVQNLEPWPIDFTKFVSMYYATDLKTTKISDDKFHHYLSQFLFSRGGAKYQRNFFFKEKLRCGRNTPQIAVAIIEFNFKRFERPDESVSAMDNSELLTNEAQIHGYVTVWCKMFIYWLCDKLIGQELLRNIILALICVMGTTAILIAEVQTCFWILLSVLLTLLNISGFMYFWGQTINIVSCIGLQLAIGLSVDYAAHIAHAFLNAESREDDDNARRTRALIAVRHIGAAVIHGASTTFIGILMTSYSKSFVFISFFRIFIMVILFGLWNGLILLPVVLSSIGPQSLRVTQQPQEMSEKFIAATDDKN
ncbi:PREDICTED: uncharacterized protein LOC105450244 [Wasmannia auropunctata]|uniref:uncharacterized protein LOC105450244 n=1 Tax=Wasmannia auropunctata TaxID=64793 RepID=UPI0005ED5548|nr:PREDICTED: uncharacterized protein LOC105450244 [Wasmannia auropunctata]